MNAGAPLRALDAGGGLPVLYGDESSAAAEHSQFGRTIIDAIQRASAGGIRLELVVERGRAIVADAGVLYTKDQGGKRFVIVDAAMTELIRPALYRAYHAVMPVRESAASAPRSPADVVGPVCESGDFLARGRSLPALSPGDLIAIRGAGAYAASMTSNYNARPFAAEVLLEGTQARLIRRRQTLESLWRDEIME